MKRIRTMVAAIVAFAVPAMAGAQTLDGGWYQFGFGQAPSLAHSFSLTSLNPFNIRVVDGFIVGDRFQLNWSGTSTGMFQTSPIANNDGVQSSAFDGNAAWSNPDLSRGQRVFAAGTYNFDVDIIRNAPGTSGGGAFIDATTVVPEPATWALLATGLAGAAFARRKRRA